MELMGKIAFENSLKSLILYHPGTDGNIYEAIIDAYVQSLEEKIVTLEKEVKRLKKLVEEV